MRIGTRIQARVLALALAALVAGLTASPALAAVFPAYAPDAFEPDNDYLHARDVGAGVSAEAHTFHADNDQDFLKITVNAGDVIQAKADNNGGTDPRAWIYDSTGVIGGNQLVTNDQAQVGPTPDAEARWRAKSAGTYYIRFMTGPTRVGYYLASVSAWPSAEPSVAVFEALDRYGVAASAARAIGAGVQGGSSHVIVACGLDRAAADSLVASGLSGVYGYAPILLTQGYVLPSSTRSALAAMSAEASAAHRPFRVHIVGGTGSVPDSMKKLIAGAAPRAIFDRIAGIDRYSVAAGVAARMRSVLGAAAPKTCLVVNGRDAAYYSDALACGPAAARAHVPILLVYRLGVPAVTSAAMASYTEVIPVATAGALTSTVIAKVQSHGTQPLTGDDRYRLARVLAETARKRAWIGGDAVAVANRFPDALSAGPYAGKANAALLFSDSVTTSTTPLPDDTSDYIQRFVCGGPAATGPLPAAAVFGGSGSVPLAIRARVFRLAGSNR